MNVNKKYMIGAAIAVILICLFFGWKIPVFIRIETLDLPEGCETVYPVKVHISDVYWLHVKGEKVIKCDLDYREAKEYIETHNSEAELKYIQIYECDGMSDIAIYDSELDEDFWKQPDRDHYITISFFRKL